MTPARRGLLHAALGGVAYGFAHVGFGVWPLVFVCLAVFWRGLDPGQPGRAALGGAVFGGVAYAIAMGWLLPTASRFAGAGDGVSAIGLALWIAQGLWIALGFAVAGAASAQALRFRWPLWIAGPVPLVLVEWAQPQVFGAGVGAALATVPVLAQPAAIGGPLLLTSLVALVNACLALATDRAAPERRGAAVFALALLAVVAFGGAARMTTFEEASATGVPLRVGLVQADLDPRASRIDAAPGHRAHLEASRRLLETGPVDLLVWPEGAYARALPATLPLDGQFVREDLQPALLFGANRRTVEAGRQGAHNSAFLVSPEGRITSAYDKRRLVPFAEADPGGVLGRWRTRRVPNARNLVAGRAATAHALGAHRLATPICYEITHARDVRALVRETGATLLVTLSDDGWFGRSREPEMHLAIARLRAIELGRWLVRAASNGPSAIVDPMGRIVARTPAFAPATLRGTVHARDDVTPYARFGDGVVGLAWLAIGAIGGLQRHLRG